MKWINKGHERNLIYEKYTVTWGKGSKVYVFGAGKMGQRISETYIKFGCFIGYIDNDINKQNKTINGYAICSIEQYLEKRDGCIIIGVSDKYCAEIINQLVEMGLQKDEDFYVVNQYNDMIFPELLYTEHDIVYVNLAQISLTERCTLKCKKCAHGCYAVSNERADLPLEEVYKSADAFFSIVDYIAEFVLIGGEPFLYKEIGKAIEYIGRNYREKIGIFSITTNGTIVPSDYVLSLCHEYDVVLRISNYQKSIPRLAKQYEILDKKLELFNVTHWLGNIEHNWFDYGFDYLDRMAGEKELTQVFDACKTPCREVRGNKYYYCVMARTVSENLEFNVGERDYLDLDTIGEARRIFVEFERGFSEKGYLDMCNYCYGAETAEHLIPVAEQKL